jgi:NTE family protein
LKVNGVFEGGGVRGTAFVGAAQVIMESGYEWNSLAGTSAGSVIAALLACGYTWQEIKEKIYELSYQDLLKRSLFDRIPVAREMEFIINLGLYGSEELEAWVGALLAEKGIRTFADLPPNKLKMIASDLTHGRMIVFPDDLEFYGVSIHEFKVAMDVRMSSNIPYFLKP